MPALIHRREQFEQIFMTSTSINSSEEIAAFLNRALAGGALAVAELEAEARAAGLLRETQQIQHAKVFKRVKKFLGIRSRRDGFGVGGKWVWLPPAQSVPLTRDGAAKPDFNAAEQTCPGPIANAPETLPAEFENRRIPRQWVDGVLHLDYNRPPTGVPLIRWRQLINDCHKFLAAEENWAERAAMFGWDAFALFGCHRSRPLEHLGSAGLLWAINGGNLVELHRDWAAIERQQDKSRQVYHRRRQDRADVTLPWIGLRAKNGTP
jgi:hypothetical protein